MPCADCAGIQTTITLNSFKTYKLREEYLGKENAVYEFSGSFRWESNGTTIVLENLTERPARYIVGDGLLIQLDMNGKKITGVLKDNYILAQVDGKLVNKHWTLIELSGKPVDGKKAYITFSHSDNRVSGNSDCNDFSGHYRLPNHQRIVLSDLVSTQKMCIGMDIEKQMIEAIKSVDRYDIINNILTLYRQTTPLAKFEVK
jgi:heat shock protein HslJ